MTSATWKKRVAELEVENERLAKAGRTLLDMVEKLVETTNSLAKTLERKV